MVSDTAAEEEPGRDVSVSVTSDMSAGKVAKLLERKGLVKSADVFKIQMKVTGYEAVSYTHLGSIFLKKVFLKIHCFRV